MATLARNGLVEFEEIPQDGKPDRKVYSITDKGRQELLKGLSNPKPTHKVRSEFLAMMCFAHLMTEEQINTVIDNKLGEIDKFLKILGEIPDCECESMSPGTRFVAGFGVHIANALRQYIQDNREMLTQNVADDVQVAVGQ